MEILKVVKRVAKIGLVGLALSGLGAEAYQIRNLQGEVADLKGEVAVVDHKTNFLGKELIQTDAISCRLATVLLTLGGIDPPNCPVEDKREKDRFSNNGIEVPEVGPTN